MPKHKETLDSILCRWCFVALSEAINYCAAESHKNLTTLCYKKKFPSPLYLPINQVEEVTRLNKTLANIFHFSEFEAKTVHTRQSEHSSCQQ